MHPVIAPKRVYIPGGMWTPKLGEINKPFNYFNYHYYIIIILIFIFHNIIII